MCGGKSQRLSLRIRHEQTSRRGAAHGTKRVQDLRQGALGIARSLEPPIQTPQPAERPIFIYLAVLNLAGQFEIGDVIADLHHGDWLPVRSGLKSPMTGYPNARTVPANVSDFPVPATMAQQVAVDCFKRSRELRLQQAVKGFSHHFLFRPSVKLRRSGGAKENGAVQTANDRDREV